MSAGPDLAQRDQLTGGDGRVARCPRRWNAIVLGTGVDHHGPEEQHDQPPLRSPAAASERGTNPRSHEHESNAGSASQGFKAAVLALGPIVWLVGPGSIADGI